jgi:hypothetical protein
MRLRLEFSSLRETKAMEYARRFVFGGLVTVAASLVAKKWGPVIGGLFLAFPGIFPPGVNLVETHKIEHEASEGKHGVMTGRKHASAEAAGASEGALGLAVFAIVVWKMSPSHPLAETLLAACLGWVGTAWLAWWVRARM